MPRPQDATARARILRASAQLFYERGVNGAGIADIVAVAGTGRNVLYRHFPTKEDLVLAYLTDFALHMDEAVADATRGLSPDRALVALAGHIATMVSRPGYRGCPFRNYLRETRDTSEAPGRLALERVLGLRRQIDELVADLEVSDKDQVAMRIWLVVEGMYATTPYPDRAAVADAGVREVAALVGNTF